MKRQNDKKKKYPKNSISILASRNLSEYFFVLIGDFFYWAQKRVLIAGDLLIKARNYANHPNQNQNAQQLMDE